MFVIKRLWNDIQFVLWTFNVVIYWKSCYKESSFHNTVVTLGFCRICAGMHACITSTDCDDIKPLVWSTSKNIYTHNDFYIFDTLKVFHIWTISYPVNRDFWKENCGVCNIQNSYLVLKFIIIFNYVLLCIETKKTFLPSTSAIFKVQINKNIP